MKIIFILLSASISTYAAEDLAALGQGVRDINYPAALAKERSDLQDLRPYTAPDQVAKSIYDQLESSVETSLKQMDDNFNQYHSRFTTAVDSLEKQKLENQELIDAYQQLLVHLRFNYANQRRLVRLQLIQKKIDDLAQGDLNSRNLAQSLQDYYATSQNKPYSTLADDLKQAQELLAQTEKMVRDDDTKVDALAHISINERWLAERERMESLNEAQMAQASARINQRFESQFAAFKKAVILQFSAEAEAALNDLHSMMQDLNKLQAKIDLYNSTLKNAQLPDEQKVQVTALRDAAQKKYDTLKVQHRKTMIEKHGKFVVWANENHSLILALTGTSAGLGVGIFILVLATS